MALKLAIILVCTFAAIAAQNAAAREAGDLGTDRDAFTPSTHTVDPGTVLSEGSYVFIDNPVGLPINNYPELLVRVGGNDWFEWRFGCRHARLGEQRVFHRRECQNHALSSPTACLLSAP